MIELPLFPGYRPDLDWSKARVDEARDFIKMVLTTIVKPDERFLVGYSGGKDSTLLLQLMLEVLDELGDSFKKRLLVSVIFTRYELDFQREHMERQVERIKALGIDVKKFYTRWDESYGVVTLGVGVISNMLRNRECNQMKSGPVHDAKQFANFTFSGARSEESAKRRYEERISLYNGDIETARPLKFIKEQDVWGYIHYLEKTKWGLSYDELRNHYDRGGNNRDGCWVCCFHKGTQGYSPAQKRVIEKLDLIRGKGRPDLGDTARSPDYPGRTVDYPTGLVKDYDEWFYSSHYTITVVRPINVCKQAYEIVKRIEREENEVGKIIFPEEHILIKDIHTLRERYNIHRGKRWMLNKKYWCGRNLLDMNPFTEEMYSKYEVPPIVMKRCNGDWFGRLAREQERLPLWRTWEKKNDYPYVRLYFRGYKEHSDNVLTPIFKNSGYIQDESKEPFPGFYSDGDPAAYQEKCKLEVVARTWMNE